MSVHDAEPGDIYVDENGKLWRCVAICTDPTVEFEAVEGYVQPSISIMGGVAGGGGIAGFPPPTPQIIKDRRRGGVSGLMWANWKRIFRRELPKYAATEQGPNNPQAFIAARD